MISYVQLYSIMVLLLSDAEHVSFLMDAAQAADRLKGTTMTKEEFLNALGNKLSEDLSGSEIASELRYYEGYI